jgi:hypothetical protein
LPSSGKENQMMTDIDAAAAAARDRERWLSSTEERQRREWRIARNVERMEARLLHSRAQLGQIAPGPAATTRVATLGDPAISGGQA